MLLDRCYCYFYLGWGRPIINKNLIAKNCKFTILDSDENYIFYNCTIIPNTPYIQVNGENTKDSYCNLSGSFYNCIIRNGKAYLHNPDDTSEDIKVKYTKALYDNYNSSIDVTQKCSLDACYANSSEGTDISKLTKEDLENNKYYGTDGTVVGCYGGENPFSLKNTDLPDCTYANKVHFNTEQQQIEVKINVNFK